MDIKLEAPLSPNEARHLAPGTMVEFHGQSFVVLAVSKDRQTLSLRQRGNNGITWDAPNGVPRFTAGSRMTDFI